MITRIKNLFLASCLTCTLLPAAGFANETHSVQTPPLPAVTATVHEVKISKTQPQVELVATVQAVLQASIAAKVTGTVTELPVVLGSRVSRGDLLLRISAEEISARVQQAQAQLAQARRNLAREKKLLKKKATTRETVKSMQDMYAVAEAALKEARTMLDYTTIRAPFSGVITRKMVNSGDLATPGIPLLKLEDDTRLQAVTSVPESLIRLLHEGDKLPVQVPSARATITGTVAEIAPAADPLTRTAPVKIDLDKNPDLRTGQFARISLPVDLVSTIMIPSSAIVPLGQMDRVFVLEDGRARLRLVRTGRKDGNQTEILAGLDPGDTIITSNNKLLLNGQPVQVEKP